MKIATKE